MHNRHLQPTKHRAINGITLVEVMLVLMLVVVLTLPTALLLTQFSKSSRGTYIQTTRSMILNYTTYNLEAQRPTYTSSFNDAAMDTSISDSSQTLPFMRKVDAGQSSLFKRVSYLYLYQNAADAVTSYIMNSALTQTFTEYRMRCGAAAPYIDLSGNVWQPDNAYDGTNKVPGYTTAGTTGTSALNIVNVTGTDDAIFQSYREKAASATVTNDTFAYSFDIETGLYVVQLYFAELDNAVVSGSRKMDIYLNGQLQNTVPYDIRAVTNLAGSAVANIQTYLVPVTSSPLTIQLQRSAGTYMAGTTKGPILSAIVIRKKVL